MEAGVPTEDGGARVGSWGPLRPPESLAGGGGADPATVIVKPCRCSEEEAGTHPSLTQEGTLEVLGH